MKNLMILLTITMVGFMLTANAIAKTIVTDGLVSYWTFDQGTIIGKKVKDVWGDNDATIFGNPREVDGYVKEGLKLDGDGDYVSLPNVGNFGSRIGAYTFEVWFNTENKKNWSAIYRVLEKDCGRWNQGTGIMINARSGRGHAAGFETVEDWITIERSRIRDNGCGSSGSGRVVPVSDGEWHQLVYTTRPATQDDADEFREFGHVGIVIDGCYRNACYADAEKFMSPLSCSNRDNLIAYILPIFLGAENNMGKASNFFEGLFDEVRIYDRALTEDEVVRNYKSGIGLSVEAVEKLPTVWGALKGR